MIANTFFFDRWTNYFYDALRRLILTRDPLGNMVRQEWCSCGGLEKLIDANGNSTRWERGAQERITKEVRADNAENRLLAVNNGTHRSEFTYDGLSRRVRIVEKDNSVVTSDHRFLWCDLELCEERDSTGATTTKRFFAQGEEQGTDDFFYTRDHLAAFAISPTPRK